MTCRDLDQFLYPYIDGEYDAEDRLEIEAHLGSCEACARRVHQEARFRDIIRVKASFRRPSGPKASSGLRRSIIAGLRREEQRRAMHGWLRMSAAAVAVVAVGGGAVVMLRPPSRKPYLDDAAARHARQLPMEIEIKDGAPEQMEAWFGGKLDHRVAIPRLPNATVTGGRLSNVKDRPAAYIRYETASGRSPSPRRVGLFVYGDADGEVEAPDLPVVAVDQSRGYNVAIWRDGEIVYQLVSDLEEEDIRRMVSSGALRPASSRVDTRPPLPELDVQPAALQR
jgi:anti-sigma factor RsiW